MIQPVLRDRTSRMQLQGGGNLVKGHNTLKKLSQRMNLAANDFPNLHTDACYSPIYYYLKQLMIPIPCAVIDIFVSMKYNPICLFSC